MGGIPLSEPKKQNYLHGAAILAAGVVIMKILGAIYKIPLRNILGDAGYGYFNAAYSIYNVLLTISTAGLPVALSRMISASSTLGRYNQVRRTFRVAYITLAVLGALLSALMLLFPSEMAIILVHTPESTQSVFALAPAVLLVCITSAYRGYIQGHADMRPTTVGQVLEVLVKVIVGLTLAEWLLHTGESVPMASAGAIFGVTAGALAALIYMAVKCRPYRALPDSADVPQSARSTFARFVKIGVPITLGASVMSVITLLDTNLVNVRLLDAGLGNDLADTLYGSYSAMLTLYNLPAAFITPLTISVVPAISAAVAARDNAGAGEIAESSLRISTVISLPMGVGLSVLAFPIVNVLYSDTHEIGPTLLVWLGVASFFVCMALMTNAILQAGGNEKYPVWSMLAGGAVKLIVNWVLVGDPEVNIVGAPIGTICCYAVMCVMNALFMLKCMKRPPNFAKVLLRPALSSAVMGLSAWAVYGLAVRFIGGPDMGRLMMTLCMCAAIFVAVAVYLVMVIATRAVTYEDMKLVPKGEKLARILHIK